MLYLDAAIAIIPILVIPFPVQRVVVESATSKGAPLPEAA